MAAQTKRAIDKHSALLRSKPIEDLCEQNRLVRLARLFGRLIHRSAIEVRFFKTQPTPLTCVLALDSQRGETGCIVVGVGIALDTSLELVHLPHLKVLQVSQHRHIADQLCAGAQQRMN